MLRRLTKTAAANAIYWSRLTGGNARRAPLVLGYHRVVPDARAAMASACGMAISLPMLESHLDHVGRTFRFVTVREAADAMAAGRRADGLAAVTFDDGYDDVVEHALPLLRRKGIPAAVFVVTDRTSDLRPLLHDRLWAQLQCTLGRACAERLTPRLLRRWSRSQVVRLVEHMEATAPTPALLPKVLNWQQVRELQRSDITIGSHTRTHPILTLLTDREARAELLGSREAIAQALNAMPDFLAYPDGQFSPRLAAIAVDAGYRFAFTTCSHRAPGFPLHTLPRLMLWEHSSLDALGHFSAAVLACQCAGIFERLAPCRRPHVDETAC